MALQGRSFEGVIYPDSESYSFSEVYENIRNYFDFYAFCTHDLDVNDDGILKKVHVHWCGQLSGPRLLSTVSNKIGLPEHDIEICKNWKACVRYLIHAGKNDMDKAQYKIEDIITNLDLSKYFREDSEQIQVNKIREYIRDQVEARGGLFYYELFDWCAENNCIHELKRFHSAYSSYLSDMNLLYRCRQDRRIAMLYRAENTFKNFKRK